jgi:metacaspase-1
MKRSLLVGINKYPRSPLNGCVNDVLAMREVLKLYGFTDPINNRMLVDEAATADNIYERLIWLIKDAQPGDSLFFHYSGHGSQVISVDYEHNVEPDGLDEILCPVDMDFRNRDTYITDNDLQFVFDKLPEGVDLTVVLDCCHSGRFNRGNSPNNPKFIPTPADILNRGNGLDLKVKHGYIVEDLRANAIIISGCQENQTSADAWIHNKYQGACSYFLQETLDYFKYNVELDKLVACMTIKYEKHKYEQRSELACKPTQTTALFLGGMS